MAGTAVPWRLVAGAVLALACALVAGWLLLGDEPGSAPGIPPPRTGAPGPARPSTAPPLRERQGGTPPADPRADSVEGPGSSPVLPPEFDGLPLRVEVRDGLSGEETGATALFLLPKREAPGSSLPERAAFRGDGTAFLLPSSPLRPGESGTLLLEARLPDGFVPGSRDSFRIGGLVSAFAGSLRAEILLWPEAKVRLRVEEEDGRPVPEATLASASAAGLPLDARAEPTDGRGETLVRGVPFLRGERVVVHAGIGWRTADSPPVVLAERDGEHLLRVVLPREDSGIGFGGGAGGIFDGRRGGHRHLVLGDTGTLRATVLRRDGRPVPGVRVAVGAFSAETDALGEALLEGVPVGRREVSGSAPGFVADTATVDVAVGVEARVELRQGEGATGEVTVLDADGLPAAGATLEVTTPGGLRYCLMEGDVQVLGIHAGPDGRRLLPHLPPGPAAVTASLGSRSAAGAVEGGGTVEIRLPEAK